MELRVRREDDLDDCERLARAVYGADGYPPRCADDLRLFVSTPDALGAWVAGSDTGIVGHVALQPKSSLAVVALACEATDRPPDQRCVVSRSSSRLPIEGRIGSFFTASAAQDGPP